MAEPIGSSFALAATHTTRTRRRRPRTGHELVNEVIVLRCRPNGMPKIPHSTGATRLMRFGVCLLSPAPIKSGSREDKCVSRSVVRSRELGGM
jgi:hypothetical protein